jgi:hypothetical protein
MCTANGHVRFTPKNDRESGHEGGRAVLDKQRGHGKHDANGSVIRWCFANASLAAAFASKFGWNPFK